MLLPKIGTGNQRQTELKVETRCFCLKQLLVLFWGFESGSRDRMSLDSGKGNYLKAKPQAEASTPKLAT